MYFWVEWPFKYIKKSLQLFDCIASREMNAVTWLGFKLWGKELLGTNMGGGILKLTLSLTSSTP